MAIWLSIESVGLHKYEEDAREARTISLIPYKLGRIELLELCKFIRHFEMHSLEKNLITTLKIYTT